MGEVKVVLMTLIFELQGLKSNGRLFYYTDDVIMKAKTSMAFFCQPIKYYCRTLGPYLIMNNLHYKKAFA